MNMNNSELKYSNKEAAKISKAANMMKAIAHPIRLAILGALSDGKEHSVTELHYHVNVEQSTASHHLGIMKDKGIVVPRREGKNIFYKLKNPNLKKLVECINMCACIDD
jgi:DNA-binding transcriptional ArsR family regulator